MLRPGEVVKLRWDWIKQDCLTIPAEHMKMKRLHRVPLTAYALSLLNEAKNYFKAQEIQLCFSWTKIIQNMRTVKY